jgi:hypothetical protein
METGGTERDANCTNEREFGRDRSLIDSEGGNSGRNFNREIREIHKGKGLKDMKREAKLDLLCRSGYSDLSGVTYQLLPLVQCHQ